MSFTRFLAASRSIMGLRKKPGPYRMNEDHLLPRFEPVRKLNGSAPEGAVSGVLDEAAESGEGHATDARTGATAPRRPRLLSRMAGRVKRLVRRDSAPARKPSAGKRAVQTELSLDTVKVVRNDLTDSDFQGETGGRHGSRSDGGKGRAQPLGMVWNRLSARLLRQAAQEFNLVQKERGKLLSHTGNGAAGSRGA